MMGWILKVLIISAAILFLPGLPPYGEFQSYIVTPAAPLTGPLAPGDFALNNVEKLFLNQLEAPEGLAASPSEEGVFYATLGGGTVAKFTDYGNRMETVTKLGKPCAALWDEKKCGRPLGIRFDNQGYLIASDAYFGIFKINVTTGETINLVSETTEVGGKTTKIFNSVAVSKDDLIYYTASSTQYRFFESIAASFTAPSGRLLLYNPKKDRNELLVDNIHFANGLILSPNEDFAVIAETAEYRLLKYWIKGPKKGTTEVLLDGLPGGPDNLSRSPSGNFYLSLVISRLPGQFDPLEFMLASPMLRKFVLRVLHLFKIPLDLADNYLNLSVATYINYYLMNLATMKAAFPPYAILLEVDWNGRIVKSWHSNRADLNVFSEALHMGKYLFLGSPVNSYLGRLKVD